MKRLQRYYYQVGIPVLLLFIGTALFFDEIAATIRGNPHPQINYVIFIMFIYGSFLMMTHVIRINKEGRLAQDFLEKLKSGEHTEAVELWLKRVNAKGSYDVADLLHQVLELQGRVVGPVEHAAIEAEIERFQSQQQRRLLLAQYFGGLMVGMGLFGTFIGLLGALQEIGKLIGGFAIGPGMSDPVAAVSELVTRLTEPMKAMGVAFSASLFGVLGSMVMGMLMVFVKGGAAELVSLVHSRVTWMLDLSQAEGGGSQLEDEPLQDALSRLAEHSPLLKGLALALDQSERRVRELLSSNAGLVARMDAQTQSAQRVVELFQDMVHQQAALSAGMDRSQTHAEQVSRAFEVVSQQITQQTQLLNEVLSGQQRVVGEFASQHQQALARFKDMADASQRSWTTGMQAVLDEMHQGQEGTVAALGRMAASHEEKHMAFQEEMRRHDERVLGTLEKHAGVYREFLLDHRKQGEQQLQQRQEQHHQLREGMAMAYASLAQEFSSERQAWGTQLEATAQAVLASQQLFTQVLRNSESQQTQASQGWKDVLAQQGRERAELLSVLRDTRQTLGEVTLSLRAADVDRKAFLYEIRQVVEEGRVQAEQIKVAHTLVTTD